jgi:autotransporter translocation and assembly factor TamB
MRPVLRIALRTLTIGAGLALLLALAGALLVTALSRGWQRERLVHVLETQLGDALEGTLRIGSLQGSLLGGFRAQDVELRAEGQPPLEIAAVDVQFELEPLLRARRLEVRSLVVEGLRVAVEEHAEGWRVSGVGRPLGGEPDDDDTEDTPFPLAAIDIGKLVVRDARGSLLLGGVDEGPEPEPAGETRLALGLDGTVQGLQWRRDEPFQLPGSLAAELGLEPSTIAGRAIERGTLIATLENQELRVSRAAVASDAGSISLDDGVVELADSLWPPRVVAVRTRATVAALDLGALSGQSDLRTRLDGPVTVSFTPDASGDPTAGRLVLDADLASKRLGPLAIDRVRIAGSLHTETLVAELEQALLQGPLGEVRASGAGDPAGLERGELRADLRLERLPAAWLGGDELAGRLRADASARGAWDDPRGKIELRVEELQRGPSLGPGTLVLRGEATGAQTLRIDELALTLPEAEIRSEGAAALRLLTDAGSPPGVVIEQLTLRGPGLRVRASGRATTESARALRIELDATDLDALGESLAAGPSLAGRIRGWIEANGAWSAPALRGELVGEPLVVDELTLERIDLVLDTDGARQLAVARLRDGGIERVRLEMTASRKDLFRAPATLFEQSDTRARLHAESLDVTWLGGLLGRDPEGLAGTLDADVRLTGAREAPRASGGIRLIGGELYVEALAGPVGPIEADLRFEGSALRVERLHIVGAQSEGEIRGSGHVHWDASAELADTDLRVEFADFALPLGGLISGRLAGALALQGTWPDLQLGGRVEMRPGQFRLPEAGEPAWEEIRIHGLEDEVTTARQGPQPPRSPREWPEVLDRARANVALALAGDSRVIGQGADLRVEGEVRLLKEPGEAPLYVGSIRTTEGHYRFRNRRFEIERGSATLAGTRQLDPELDIVAAQDVGDVTLRIVVSGRASAPVVTLESDPPLDATDQLSYLAFGRPASALGSSDAAQLESAATQVVGQILLGSGVGSGLFEGLPLDRFAFEAGGGATGTEVSLGAEVAKGVRIFYDRDLGTGMEGARIEWRFHRNWLIQSEVDEEGETGADVIWTFEF